MNSNELREEFLKFFESKNHLRMESASLLPGDSTLLFTSAGMVPLKPYFLGEMPPPAKKITTVQKCLRTNDIEKVGYTARHHTFFEMLGNFSIGDYFKEEAILMAWEFITKNLLFPKEDIWVTVFYGDDESKTIWKKIGIKEEKTIERGEEDNFWTMGPVGPCGPCSEIYVDRGIKSEIDEKLIPGDEGKRFLEVWNLVFTQYDRNIDGSLSSLPFKNIDTGMGLERTLSILQNTETDFETDLFMPIINKLEEMSKISYNLDNQSKRRMRTISDHMRAITFLIADSVLPSNEKQGYVLRRLIRRAASFGNLLGLKEAFLYKLVPIVSSKYGKVYKEVQEKEVLIEETIKEEEGRFKKSLSEGLLYLEEKIEELLKDKKDILDGEIIFYLHDTLGFPYELTSDILKENSLKPDKIGFEKLLEEQKRRGQASFKGSRKFVEDSFYLLLRNKLGATRFSGYEKFVADSKIIGIIKGTEILNQVESGDQVEIILDQTPFYGEKGGQAGDSGILKDLSENSIFQIEDTQTPVEDFIIHKGIALKDIVVGENVLASVDIERRKAIMRAHTATHIIQSALRNISKEIYQKGSKVEDDYFHFDFNYKGEFAKENFNFLEDYALDTILKNIPVEVSILPYKEAIKKGALAFFGEKYKDIVRIIEIPQVSIELCGGTHVKSTGDIGILKIKSIKSIGVDLKRIEVYTGKKAYSEFKEKEKTLQNILQVLEVKDINTIETNLISLKNEVNLLKKEIESSKDKEAYSLIENANVEQINGLQFLFFEAKDSSIEKLKYFSDLAEQKMKNGIFVGFSPKEVESQVLIKVFGLQNKKISAKEIFKNLEKFFIIKGGGKDSMVQGIVKAGSVEIYKKIKEYLEHII